MKRLIDDPEIVTDLRAELRRYAGEQAPLDLKAAYADLQETLQLKAAEPAPIGKFSGGAWSALSGSTKLLIVAAVGGSVALGVGALRSKSSDERPHQQVQAIAQPTTPALPRPVAQVQPAVAPPAPAPEPTANRAPAASSGSRREIAQLARIKAVLEEDPAAARRLIRAAQREFPAGLLVEEREGLDVIALFRLGQRDRARGSAERFVARYPQSPLRPKLERLIADVRE